MERLAKAFGAVFEVSIQSNRPRETRLTNHCKIHIHQSIVLSKYVTRI